MRHALFAGLVVLLLSPRVHAQGGAAATTLSQARKATCVFSSVASALWNATGIQANVKPATLKFGFDQINTDEGTARIVGPFGPADIVVRLSTGALHFVQSYREGALYATTIFAQETSAGKLKAVHTRHEFTEVILPGFTSRPEQYLRRM